MGIAMMPRLAVFYANNAPKSALARDLGDCRDNKGKLAKRVFTCYSRRFSQDLPDIFSLYKKGLILWNA